MNKQKLLIITSSYYPLIGGVEKHVQMVSKKLKKRYEVIIFVAYNSKIPGKQIVDGTPVYRLPKNPNLKNLVWWLIRKPTLLKNVSLVHSHDYYIASLRRLLPHASWFHTFHGYESYPIPRSAIKILDDKRSFSGRKHVIVGGGELYEDLKKFIRLNGLEKRVSLLGFVSEKQLSRLYRTTDLVIYLTLDETFGLPFAEAGLYKKAVVGPNHGGPRELIQNGITGIQVDALKPAAIAAGIHTALKNKHQLIKMGQSNFSYVMNNLTFNDFTDRFLKIVKKYDQ